MKQVTNNQKLRVVVRDLHPGAQIAQSAHAVSQFSVEHPEKFKDWFESSQYIACLSIEDEEALLKLADKLESRGVSFSVFKEPDYNFKSTSITIEACNMARRLTGSLPLAQREYYDKWAEDNKVEEDSVSNYHIDKIKKDSLN